jgi:hypothetical protein
MFESIELDDTPPAPAFIPPADREDHVRQVLLHAQEELVRLMQQRAELMKRIGTVKKTVAGLANLFGEENLSSQLRDLIADPQNRAGRPAFTTTCRLILMKAEQPLTVRDLCDHIREKAPPLFASNKNLAASVTTVLGRLVKYGEAEVVRLPTGRKAWRWIAVRT